MDAPGLSSCPRKYRVSSITRCILLLSVVIRAGAWKKYAGAAPAVNSGIADSDEHARGRRLIRVSEGEWKFTVRCFSVSSSIFRLGSMDGTVIELWFSKSFSITWSMQIIVKAEFPNGGQINSKTIILR